MPRLRKVCDQFEVDKTDLVFCLFFVCVFSLLVWVEGYRFIRLETDIILFVICFCYILYRGIQEPKKLQVWGLFTPLTISGIFWAVLLLAIGIGFVGVLSPILGGQISFRISFLRQMFRYTFFAFPQQFILCSIFAVSLYNHRFFRGKWRLPLFLGIFFSLCHFWTTPTIPGTILPIEMLLSLVGGFFATKYFLAFWNIIPLIIIHAILHPLFHNWIEIYLQNFD